MTAPRRTRRSANFDARPAGRSVDLIILHYTGMRSAEAALDRLTNPGARVSAHFLIDEDGTTYELVDPRHRAWHAGVSAWEGTRALNDTSIGIELVNPGHEWGYRPFPPAQMDALIALLAELVGAWRIPFWRVLGHSDVAPSRKEDPGELFDWRRLAAAGFGVWPERPGHADDVADRDAEKALSEIGYRVDPDFASLPQVATAFQRHFRGTRVDGELDLETHGLILAVRDLLRQHRTPS